jgi:hypothetical protein
MANQTIKGLTPGATYKAHRAYKAAPYLHYREQIPGAPIVSGAADSSGTLVLDLPVRTEVVVQGADGRGIYVNNATTVVTTQ